MVFFKEKLIFIHIPKTGGVSIEDFLLEYFNKGKRSARHFVDGFGQNQNMKGDGFVTVYPYMHFPLPWVEEELKRINVTVDDTWNMFSIVRNPYHRIISELFFNTKSNLIWNYHSLPPTAKGLYFNECLDNYFNSGDSFHNAHSLHTMPQSWFFEGTKLERVYICKFEDGLKNIMETLGFKIEGNFPHKMDIFGSLNIPKPNYKDVLTGHFVNFINERYQKDFEKFDYEMLDPRDFPN